MSKRVKKETLETIVGDLLEATVTAKQKLQGIAKHFRNSGSAIGLAQAFALEAAVDSVNWSCVAIMAVGMMDKEEGGK